MYATKGDDNYFFPVNMQIGIKRYNKTKKRTLPHCLYLIITFMFVNMTKIDGNFSGIIFPPLLMEYLIKML